jgi:hypothetical protein
VLGCQVRHRRRGYRPEAHLSAAPKIVLQQRGDVHAMVYVEAGRVQFAAEAERLRPAERDNDVCGQDLGNVPVIDAQCRFAGAGVAEMSGCGG